jgi:uncharacterized damage-inducible protein DinB
MKSFKFRSVLLIAVCLFLSTTAFSQIMPKVAEKAWDNMTKMVIDTANAMPGEHYTFNPAEGLRNFTEQIGHTTGANYLFASVVKLKRPNPSPTSKTTEKAQVIKELTASFAFIKGGIQKLTQADLDEESQFFGRKMSRMQAFLIMTSHLQRE